MKDTGLPQNVRRLADNETFRFSCHPGVPCFTECCRQLDLALTPYDVLRLRQALKISSSEFLEKYVLVEKTAEDIFPQLFLTMVDDGRASCPFVDESGCSVYADRPGACRTYPIGRAAYLDENGLPADFYVLLTEPHCHGFAEGPELSLAEWIADQELAVYNRHNDQIMSILQHPRIKEGFRPDDKLQEKYLHVLYDIDAFREEIGEDGLDDIELLKKAINILENELFR
jgi:Fe-S-cluster containining protein